MSHPVVPDQAGPDGERVIGIIDLGSNSLRLMLVRILPDGSHTVLNQVKNMVRLGEGAFETGHLREESMARTINVLRGMAEMCGVYGASEVIAIATAAVRDAANGPDFMRRVKEKTGIDFRVVSGREEARLIYLGVSSGLAHTESLRLFIDIGGGSTELVVGNSEEYRNLDSLKMGCVRLSNLFFDKDSGTISAKRYAALQNYIRNNALRSFQRIADFVIEEAVASSGTAQNLAEIAAALDAEDAARTGRAPQESRDVPGINPNRADVIVAGAAILQTIMEDQGFDSVRISNRNLQNGILVDYLSTRMPHADGSFHPVRKESVLHLARRCRFEERHSRHVSRLALDLFDSAKAMGLHDSGDLARELLHYAALLHDIGIFISFSRHNAHSHYLIRNTELLGFTRREVDIMAALTYFHRKRPSKKVPLFMEFDQETREEIRLLSLFLLLAERMDKSHRQIVRTVRFEARKEGGLQLSLRAPEECPIELDLVRGSAKLVRKVFRQEIPVEVVSSFRR